MKPLTAFSALVVCLLGLIAVQANSNSHKKNVSRIIPTTGGRALSLKQSLNREGLMSTAQMDTFVLGSWTFDTGQYCDWQGWTVHDRTEQTGCYWHVDDFAGLGGGSYGLLQPLEGSQSLWCGARPDPGQVLCGYATLPGYGNSWKQGWYLDCVAVPDTEAVIIDYLISWDTEANYDYVYLEYATSQSCDSLAGPWDVPAGGWLELAKLDGRGGRQFRSDTIPAGHDGGLLIRFQFTSDQLWSDEEGLYNTDGAAIVDSLTVRAELSGVIDFEDFENETLGDITTADGDWSCQTMPGFGSGYAQLFRGLSLVQEDPCHTELSCVWAFIAGSTFTYACGGHPAQIAVPKVNDRGQYIDLNIWSPKVAWTGSGSTVNLNFDVYRDLPVPNLVFYQWFVRSWKDGCPGPWRNYDFIHYGRKKDWHRDSFSVGSLIEPDPDYVQVALGVVDMCWGWCDIYGNAACHSHAPLFDNIELVRIGSDGPQWSARDVDLFQDTFPTNGTGSGTGRIDAALDVAPAGSPTIQPGDSMVVGCADPEHGILSPDPLSGSGGAVYLYVNIAPPNQPGKMAPAELEEDNTRWPLVDSTVIGGDTWYQFRCDTAFTESSGPRTEPAENKWCIDLNDNVFTNRDTLSFLFGAENTVGERTYWSEFTGTVSNINDAADHPMEMQILPAEDGIPWPGLLYVNYFNDPDAVYMIEDAIFWAGYTWPVDRYDKRGPSSCAGNGIGHRVKDVSQQLIPSYRTIVWNSGDLSSGTVGDGTGNPEKSDDWQLLFNFLDQHSSTYGAGIYLSGDDLAQEWGGSTGPSAQIFNQVYMPHVLVTGNHVTTHGISPWGIGEEDGMFDNWFFGPDSLIVFGGCPTVNDFDQVYPLGSSVLDMTYSGSVLRTDGAVISFDSTNALGNPVGVVLSGFSFHYIRDYQPGWLARHEHMEGILSFLRHILDEVDGISGIHSGINHLAQNFPNPFNPVTTINYSIKDRSQVTLKIYNVAGQLVRTLVNEQQDPRAEGYSVRWRGLSNAGEPVSTGVYFYKLNAGNFRETRKMVLLK